MLMLIFNKIMNFTTHTSMVYLFTRGDSISQAAVDINGSSVMILQEEIFFTAEILIFSYASFNYKT